MLAPSVSRRVAALVASILSIERDMSVMRPLKSRAVVGLESALNSAEFLPSVHSSSSSIALGMVRFGMFEIGNGEVCFLVF